MSTFEVTSLAGGKVRFGVRVRAGAGRNAIMGLHDGALRIHLAAPPVDGRANELLVRFIADALGVSRGAVRIVGGERGRRKLVEVEGAAAEQVQQLAKQ